jgi:translation initiation factor IF-2
MTNSNKQENLTARPPIVVVMGHIDHGKSTLLDYIRKANVVATEAGGITQHTAAYEAVHTDKEGKVSRITFIDTPGHAAFVELRSRGAQVADVAILVVSAEDGVKPQTLDALKSIVDSKIPYIVAINKIDKPNANIERTKQTLAENEIYIEEWGGKIPAVPISAKFGQGVEDLLEIVLLTAEMEELKADNSLPASGVVLEAHSHKTKGLSATLIIKNGTLKTGSYIVSEHAYAPVRVIEDFKGSKVDGATFSSPVCITGWTELPTIGAEFTTCNTKKEAEVLIEEFSLNQKTRSSHATVSTNEDKAYVPIIIKADVAGTLDAIVHEIKKLENERVGANIIYTGVGDITESDIRAASGKNNIVIVGFNVKIDTQATALRERENIEVKVFGIIYELGDYLKELFVNRTPKISSEEMKGQMKVLKYFSAMKDKQVIGARVVKGSIHVKEIVKIIRQDEEIGRGVIVELQHAKEKVSDIEEGKECGLCVESKTEIAPGDILESFEVVER